MNRCTVAHRLWLLSRRRAADGFAGALRAPRDEQERLLRTTLERNRDTAIGRRLGFGSIRTLEAYRDRVPVCTYEDLEDDVRRIRGGEAGVLTAEPVTRLIPTSGTTAAVKLIPYTAGLQRQFDLGIAPWIADLFRAHPALVDGPAYWSISPAMRGLEELETAVPIGFEDDTAYLGMLGRWLVGATQAVPNTVRRLERFDDFRYVTLLWLLASRQLRLVSVWHPSFWSMLVEALPPWWDALRHDLARGRCRLPSGRAFEARLPRRLDDLERVAPWDWRVIWPRLTVISAWGDAAAATPLAGLRRAWPGTAVQPKGIISTEAFLSLPWRERYPAAVRSHVIELLGADGVCVGLDGAEVGGRYEPVVTTAGGLYRYRTGDIVAVTGRVERTPTLRLLGRSEQTHDVCGEKLHERHVRAVLGQTLAGLGIAPTFCMLAAAEPHAPTRYELFLAAETPVDAALAERLRAEVDDRLCDNPHYAYARRVGQLGPLALHRACADAPGRVLRRMHELGHACGGVKPATLSTLPGWRPVLCAETYPERGAGGVAPARP